MLCFIVGGGDGDQGTLGKNTLARETTRSDLRAPFQFGVRPVEGDTSLINGRSWEGNNSFIIFKFLVQWTEIDIFNFIIYHHLLGAKQSKLVTSFILGERGDKNGKDSSLFDDFPTSRSQTWIGSTERRREILLAYAERQKIEQLKKIANMDIPLDQVNKIRSGYGTIKKIQCMQYFTNLKELLLYNNHIRIIEGLNNNIKLNILSLAYNKIQKAENLGHLKELKRLSLQCNKLGRSSAEYLTLYQWKNLQSLTISFHQDKKQDNQQCLEILFTGRSSIQWCNLKTLYLYNSKCMSEKIRGVVKEFMSKKKSGQVYWS